MKSSLKMLVGMLALVGLLASASPALAVGPYDLRLTQRNEGNDADFVVDLTASSTNALVGMDEYNNLDFWLLGDGLSYDGNSKTLSVIPQEPEEPDLPPRTLALTFDGTVSGGSGIATIDISQGGEDSSSDFQEIWSNIPRVTSASSDWIVGAVTIASDRLTATVEVKRQVFSGLTILGQTVLGSMSIENAPNGTPVDLVLIGQE